VLSDIISKQGETVVAHAGTQIDADSGRIRALWEIRDGNWCASSPPTTTTTTAT
jgi:hypothetical protein